MREKKRKITQIIAGITAAVMAISTVVMSPGNDESKVLAWKYDYLYSSVSIDSAHFPDRVFREYVKSAFDQNGDNKLDNDELMEARNIYCDNMDIYTLDGIEYLPELRGIYASGNHLTELDITKNQQVTGIWVAENDFTSLDFSQNPNLEWLYCYDCHSLTSLNVTGNPKMSYLEVNTCPLGTIDVSNNPLLEQLTCATCGLTELDLSNNKNLTHLDCQQNDIASLDLSNCPKMKRLDIWDNDRLNNVDVSVCPELQYYNCASNNVTSLDLSKNPELGKLNCGWNNITSLDLSHNPKLYSLSCNDNAITSLDLSNNPSLQFLMAYFNNFSSLDLSNNSILVDTINKGEKKWEDNAAAYSYTISYGIDDSYAGLDSMCYFCVDGDVTVKSSSSGFSSRTSYFEGDASDTANLLTREMVVQTLYTLAGSPDVSGLTSRFKDVEPGAWYYNALLWGEKYNVATGFEYLASDNFGIGKWCTKQEMVTMVMRFAEYMGYKRSIDFGRSDDYIDYFDVSNSCWEGVCWAATYRILPVEGEGDKTQQRIYPYKVTTRSDLTYIINGLQDANKVEITSVPIPDASYIPSGTESKGADVGTLGGSGSGSSGGGSGSGSGSSGSGSSSSSSASKGKWVQSSGTWYYYDANGNKETNCYREGYWLKSDGSIDSSYCNGAWKYNGVGWWYEDGGWYPTSQWLKIDGKWYYFLADGYMDYGEYREGCWLNDDGSWDPNYGSGTWHLNSTGWWYQDGSWYPAGQYLWVDGYKYWFNSAGYWEE